MAEEIERLNLNSLDIVDDKQQKLKELFPEVFTEGDKIDFDKLRLTLGESIDANDERFGLHWAGKKECFSIIQEPSIGTLKPAKDESVNWDDTENLFIEGDNLEVLKLLQKSYYGKVKMIYIDPPYNTGGEFIYPDKYQENLDTYLAYSGQIDDDGYKFSTNTETEGRYHSNWLNMMYPRLFLARNLLKDDGLIFISIDDNEHHNLKRVCDEIFGEDNYLSSIVWEKRFTRSNNAKTFATLTETVLCYRKSESLEYVREPRNEKADSTYTNPDNDPRGVWTSVSYVNPATKSQRPNLVYTITNPNNGKEITHPTNAWKYEEKSHKKHVEENRLYWGKEGENTYPRLKRFLSEMDNGMVPVNFWKRKDTGTTDEGSKELEKLLGGKYFDFPKPHSLIKRAISHSNSSDGICLDFFAGSCPTAHAIVNSNKESGGKRKFIMVQLPEPTDEKTAAFKAGYKNIADIGKERIRQVILQVENEKKELEKEFETKNSELKKLEAEKARTPKLFENGKSKELADLEDTIEELKMKIANIESTDLGFKVFKLDKSNFKVWDGAVENDVPKQIEMAINHLEPDSKEFDILFEILLKAGFELTLPIKELTLADKKVYSVEDDALLICLESELNEDVIRAIAAKEPARFVCLDTGFKDNDQLKTNAVQIMKSHNVHDFKTV